MKHKTYKILIDKLIQEIDNNETIIDTSNEKSEKNVAENYIKYHKEMIKFIKKVDKEVD